MIRHLVHSSYTLFLFDEDLLITGMIQIIKQHLLFSSFLIDVAIRFSVINISFQLGIEHYCLLCRCLLEPGPDVVICDEGHLLKNEKSAINKAVNRIKTNRR